MKDSLVQILNAVMAECIPPFDFDKRPEKQVSKKGTNPPSKKSILKKKASKKARKLNRNNP